MAVKKFVPSVLLAGGLVAASVFAAVPAQAAVSDCPSGNFCMWTATDYRGTMGKYSWHKEVLSDALRNNDESSFNNMSSAGMELYSGSYYSGYIGCSRPKAQWRSHSPANTT
ncbi:peptidase inhibitor family I36 protein, partial [Streptomyces sp. HB2AG]